MEKYVFLFEISNNQQEYAKCMNFLDDMHSDDIKKASDYEIEIKYLTINVTEEIRKDYLLGKGFSIWNGEDISEAGKGESTFIFHVTCSGEDDIVNLIYFCLLKSRYQRSLLRISSQNIGKVAATVPYFLYDELKKSREKQDKVSVDLFEHKSAHESYSSSEYFIDCNESDIRPMVIPGQRVVKKFSSLIEIEQIQNTSRKWGMSVGNSLMQFYRKAGWKWSEEKDTDFIFKNFWPNIVLKELLKEEKEGKANRQNRHASRYSEYRLFVIFTECFCFMADKKNIEMSRRRFEIMRGQRFFEMVKDMPLLALYIFCLFDYFSKDDREADISDDELFDLLQEKIFNARDMAEGLLQIIENVYHSEYHKGYFYFRIHTLEDGKNEYLNQNYSEYITGEMFQSELRKRHVLEVKVADYSHFAISDMFITNYEKRMNGAEVEDKKKYNEIYPDARKVTLRSFFSPLDAERAFWQKYNNIAENVVHHYGLQAFDSFVINNRGYFYVQSKCDYRMDKKEYFYDSLGEKKQNGQYTLPGSQYEVLIPFQVELEPRNTSLNVNINYTNKLLMNYKAIETVSFTSEECTRIFDDQPSHYSYQEKKEATIHTLYKDLLEKINAEEEEGKGTVLWCSAKKNIALTTTEIFCKVIMLYLARQALDKQCYVMITDCTQAHFVEITRMFTLFYDKQGASSVLKRVQIYLAGENNEEFLLAGGNVGTIAEKTEKLVFAKGVSPKCVKLLHAMLKNRPLGEENADTDIIPFDMIEYDKSRETLFEKNVRNVLEEDIQSMKFGCKLKGLHVRIGNKMHISTFYEAELLFHNNYYTSRFAYWLAQRIHFDGNVYKSQSVTLVGYETYSERLLYEIRDMLLAEWKECKPEINCIIYEQKTLEKFRSEKKLCEYADSQFLLIVPINSTTTTHSKLASFLLQSIKESQKEHLITNIQGQINIAGNYGIIVIGSNTVEGKWLQGEYWEETDKNKLFSKVLQDDVTYFIKVEGTWHDPLRCKVCFPPEDYTMERPLIETNKESIVPMHAIRINSRTVNGTTGSPEWSEEDKRELEKVKKLSEYLVYQHIVRKNNHFQYYFDMEKYFNDVSVKKDVEEWLKGCRCSYDDAQNSEEMIFNVIVAPLHFSNATFVNAVNRYFFSDAALVLHFDVEKEFRNNVKTKYSNLITLYRNLCTYDKNATINFHYADDTIVSGATYVRAHSLIQSLFLNESSPENVKVNVFASIIILLNRMSSESRHNYISDTAFFFSYVNLNISSMRNHEDACVLCKKEKEYRFLAEHSSLNDVYTYWQKKSELYSCVEIEKYHVLRQRKLARLEEEKEKRRQQRAVMRMLCSHKANLLLAKMKEEYNEENIERIILNRLLMKDGVTVEIEELISYIKVIARPFICFNKEVKGAIFSIMLKMLQYLLMDDNERLQVGDEYKDIDKCLKNIARNSDDSYLLIKILMNRLVGLGSNYIIRKNTMKALLNYASKLNTERRKNFEKSYVNRVKQLIYSGTDETKSLFLEYLLLFGEEYSTPDNINNVFESFFLTEQSYLCYVTMFLENTKIIAKGIKYLSQLEDIDQKKIEKALSGIYYLENYARLLHFHQMVNHENGKYTFCDDNYERIEGLIRLRTQLDEIIKPMGKSASEHHESTYAKVLNNIISATGADNGEFFVPYKNANDESTYLSLNLKNSNMGSEFDFDDKSLITMVENCKDYLENDTYQIDWGKEIIGEDVFCNVKVVIRYYGMQKEKERISEVYLILLFNKVKKVELYIAIKNLFSFRKDIWMMFNLTSDTLLQNWMNDRYFKMQMKKTRAVGHKDLDDLKRNLKYVVDNYEEIAEKEVLERCLSLTVDSLIGYYNIKILSGEFKDSSGNCPGAYPFEEFWNAIEKDIFTAAKLWKLVLLDKNGKNFKKEGLTGNFRRCKFEEGYVYPDFDLCKLLILFAFQGIKRHSGGNDSNTEVYIYAEDGFLYIKNKHAGNAQRIKNKLRDSERRREAGISVAVIADVCRIWYKNQEKTVDVAGDVFVVRLPIVEKEDMG